MTILVDRQIRECIESGMIEVSPYDPTLINPNSLDIRLGETFKRYTGYMCTPINPFRKESIEQGLIEYTGRTGINPGKFLLGSSVEKITLPDDICAQLTQKSSLARLGIANNITAGWIDAGFSGQITFEIFNSGSRPVELFPGMLFGQLIFHRTEPAETPYGARPGSKYQNQTGPVSSKYYLNDSRS